MPKSSSNDPDVTRWTKRAADFDRYRPPPPEDLVDLLRQMARTSLPSVVVDLGCGTGHATRLWLGHAIKAIGIEPNDTMRAAAETRTAEEIQAAIDAHSGDEPLHLGEIRYIKGYGHKTGLPDACADIVTAAQALRWMEPEPTINEIARILRPGGVFAQIDYLWPVTTDWEIDRVYHACRKRYEALEEEQYASEGGRHSSSKHFELLLSSDRFRYANEIAMHKVHMGNTEALIGLLKTHTGVQEALERGATEEEMGITELRHVAEQVTGGLPMAWYLTCRVRLAVK